MFWILLAALVASPFGDGNAAKPSLDKEGFPLPAGAIARLGSLRFSRDCTTRGGFWGAFFWASGRQVISWEKDHIIICNAETGRRVRTLYSHLDDVQRVTGSPDGRLLASAGSDQTIRIWDGASGRPLHEIQTSEYSGRLCFSPDSRLLAVATDGAVVLRKMSGGEIVRSWRIDRGKIVWITFSPDGKWLASSREQCDDSPSVTLWNLESVRPELHPVRFNSSGQVLEFSPDGETLVTFESGGPTELWSVATGKVVLTLRPANDAKFAPNGRSIALADPDSDTIDILDARTGLLIRQLRSIGGAYALAYSPDGKKLAASGNNVALRQWNVETGEEIGATTGHKSPVTSIVYCPDGSRLASIDETGVAILWDVASRSQERRLANPERADLRSVAFSPDGKSLAVGSDRGSVQVWDVKTGEKQSSFLQANEKSMDAIAFTPDGGIRAASGDGDETVWLWDVKSGEEPKRLPTGHQAVALAFDRNGTFLAMGCDDGTARLWDAGTGRELRRFQNSIPIQVDALALRPDGWALAAAHQKWPIRAWDVKTKRELPRRYPSSAVDTMAFSSDGQFLAAGCEDGSVWIWNPATGRERARFRHGSKVNTLAFAPDGQSIASGGEDGMILIWRLPKP